MRLGFIDTVNWDYTVETVYQRPLGGSQSALCYLCEALARRGHDVTMLTRTTAPGRYRGVTCMSLATVNAELVRSLDACIVLNWAGLAQQIRDLFGSGPRIVLWTGHAANEPAISKLASPATRDAHDAFVFVSDWQRAQYIAQFQIPPQRTVVLRNAIAPVFQGLFTEDADIRTAKAMPPVLAYTSTPYRGLELLVELFPAIRKAVPGVTLEVFSSMRVYQVAEEEDQQKYWKLYQACRQTEGIEYVGGISQPELAGKLRSVTALAYPNVFPETLCLAVLEAMAAGCGIISSDLGALAETTAGFGHLIPINTTKNAYIQSFCDTVVGFLRRSLQKSENDDLEGQLRRQVRFVNQHYTWQQRAEDWEAWLAHAS